MWLRCSGDDEFGPAVDPTCQSFDFTLLFEQSILGILGILSALLFAVAAPARFAYLARRTRKTIYGRSRLTKVIAALVFSGVQLSLLILWTLETQMKTRVSIAHVVANLVHANLVVALQIVARTWAEDVRSLRPSSLISTYLLFTLISDAARALTLWLRQPWSPLAATLTSRTAVKKRRYLKNEYQDPPPESTSGIINRRFLWWTNRLFREGFKKLLTYQDLYTLDSRLTPAELSRAITKAWARRNKPERRFEFPRAPFLIFRALTHLTSPDDETAVREGYGLVGAAGSTYMGLAISSLRYNQSIYRFTTVFRGAAVSLIYNHALVVQDHIYDEAAAVTLMSTDVGSIARCLVNLNECWARLLEVTVGIALLTLQLGWVSGVPVVVVIRML
ncbi:hypothetical protein B0T14DRAFT_537621 [Immersiella caudata]|uniref:ABC transporter TMD0 domain-containing protein n=1 Tax=Immersiella caudata TaxID=314043 RepID=A0AA40BZZ1_9PEZI|nr:hypothetical protein B0T14DRAFT_537621 [Immersiella caudata]